MNDWHLGSSSPGQNQGDTNQSKPSHVNSVKQKQATAAKWNPKNRSCLESKMAMNVPNCLHKTYENCKILSHHSHVPLFQELEGLAYQGYEG